MNRVAHFTDSMNAVRGDGSMPMSTHWDGLNGDGTQKFEGGTQ